MLARIDEVHNILCTSSILASIQNPFLYPKNPLGSQIQIKFGRKNVHSRLPPKHIKDLPNWYNFQQFVLRYFNIISLRKDFSKVLVLPLFGKANATREVEPCPSCSILRVSHSKNFRINIGAGAKWFSIFPDIASVMWSGKHATSRFLHVLLVH